MNVNKKYAAAVIAAILAALWMLGVIDETAFRTAMNLLMLGGQ